MIQDAGGEAFCIKADVSNAAEVEALVGAGSRDLRPAWIAPITTPVLKGRWPQPRIIPRRTGPR